VDVEAVRVEGYHEVLALHRMLMECKGSVALRVGVIGAVLNGEAINP
jgi:hypothetical protein